uniref:Putative secreted protein n=1 Tax=Anopheles marajoara TaxID=58244 RepID=A0A2M4CAY7_9DIPT
MQFSFSSFCCCCCCWSSYTVQLVFAARRGSFLAKPLSSPSPLHPSSFGATSDTPIHPFIPISPLASPFRVACCVVVKQIVTMTI